MGENYVVKCVVCYSFSPEATPTSDTLRFCDFRMGSPTHRELPTQLKKLLTSASSGIDGSAPSARHQKLTILPNVGRFSNHFVMLLVTGLSSISREMQKPFLCLKERNA